MKTFNNCERVLAKPSACAETGDLTVLNRFVCQSPEPKNSVENLWSLFVLKTVRQYIMCGSFANWFGRYHLTLREFWLDFRMIILASFLLQMNGHYTLCECNYFSLTRYSHHIVILKHMLMNFDVVCTNLPGKTNQEAVRSILLSECRIQPFWPKQVPW